MAKTNPEQEMFRDQIERLLNQSGVSVTPEILADSKFFTIVEVNGNEWNVTLRNWKFNIKRDANGIYTCKVI